MSSRIIDFFVDKDIYGQPVTVLYQGSDAFKTKLGVFFSLATYALMIFNFASLLLAW